MHPICCVIAWGDVVYNEVTYALCAVEVHAVHKDVVDVNRP